MQQKELLAILKQAGKLKTNTRHCYTAAGRKESVADHSWRIALLAMLLDREAEFADVNFDRVIRMCLIHDLGESFTGDIPSFHKSAQDEASEEAIYRRWLDGFPEPTRSDWRSLIDEMAVLETREAKVYKALDKLEAIISHDESDLSTWLPLEYDLQYAYGRENVAFSEYLSRLHDEIDSWTTEKIENEA